MSQSKQLALSLAETLEALPRKGNTNLLSAWAVELQVPGESPELFMALTVLFGRLMDLRRRVDLSTQSDRAKELYRGAIDVLAQYVNPARVPGFTTQQVAAAGSHINLLHLLADSFPDEEMPDVQPATLEALCAELEGILRSLTDAEIEPELRAFIQTNLDTLLMVLRSYKTFGPDGAARIYGSIAAELARKAHQEPPTTKAGKSTLQKAIDFTKKAGRVVIWASALTGAADKLLTDGSDIADMITGPDHAIHGAGDEK